MQPLYRKYSSLMSFLKYVKLLAESEFVIDHHTKNWIYKDQ